MTAHGRWRFAVAGSALVGCLSLALAGASAADDAQPTAPSVQPEQPSSVGPVHNLDEAKARWNPSNDPSMVITDNGNDTYGVVQTDR